MNAAGIALLRALIMKMWSLNEAREGQDCAAIATTINSWMPPGCEVTAAHVDLALRGSAPSVSINMTLLRTKIDKTPSLYSARLSGDYQAILNEVQLEPELRNATLADVVGAMALQPVPQPALVIVGSAAMVGRASMR